ncbi:MAG: hypothetical protein H0U41_02775 [Actinobacteria bacterium]|nr:hypothetical protein [Actinomycetota bacterium]
MRGHEMGMGIHGEHVTAAPGGGYQTIATQRGEVTDVNDSSIAVKSEDGFTRTYSVDDNTLVNAGNQGIADVKKGDQVHVKAIVKDGKAAAVQVNDGTQVGRIHDRWMPPPPAPGTGTGTPPN